ncbi:MAG: hypothetical protein E3J36_02550 [Candidatus Nealsonbacteria bacterium]|nr:MAG: hypothetical protein E3J36_02550 [Candidatus Nealsonbacteria bacterium]
MPPELSLIFSYIWQTIRAWWWLFLPFLLWKPFLYLWLWWRVELFFEKQRMILLEIKLPKESLKPIRAMEPVLAGLWQGFYDPPNFWEKWWDGKVILGFQFELISIGGEIHFFIRCPDYRRDILESHIYSQYPEAEISLAEDYTKNVPRSIPNKDWEMWASDYRLLKPNPYPIKTYREFETEAEREEEKRVDPVASLLESFAKIKPGEQLWVQIQVSPIAEQYAEPFFKEGETLRDKLAKRPGEPKPKPMVQEAAEILITGKVPEAEKPPEKLELIAPELRLTPGEREIVAGVENKISKPPFKCSIRFIFLGKREVWFKPNLRLGLSFFGNYVTEHMNALFPLGKTITKVYSRPPLSLLDARRLYLRKRKIFKLYIDRYPPTFPLEGDYKTGTFILNTEELASLFHFPSRRVAPAPGVLRVEAKRGEAPPEIPIE